MQNTGTSDVYYITALPFINMHPRTLVPDTMHYAIQEHSVTRLARRPASSHLISCFLSKHLVPGPRTMRSSPKLSSVAACLVGFLPLVSFIAVMKYVMFGLLRACMTDAVQDLEVVTLDQQFVQIVLGNIATLDMKAQLWVEFFYSFPLVQHFIQLECTGGWSLHLEITSPEKECIYTLQVATFIEQNWYIYTIWICAPCRTWTRMNSILTQRKAS